MKKAPAAVKKDPFRENAFLFFSLAFWAGAAYHALGLLRPVLTEPAPAWRHAAFVTVNIAAARGLKRRGKVFFAGFTVLAFQQIYSHGTYAWRVWNLERRVDWASILVLAGMPLLWVMLFQERKQISA